MAKMRLQVDLDTQTMAVLDELRRQLGAPSRGEVLRYSLVCYQWAVRHALRGNKIAAISEEEGEPVEALAMPGTMPRALAGTTRETGS